MTTGDDPLNDIYPNSVEIAMSQRERLYALHSSMCARALELMKRKNQDYGMKEDALANLRRHGPTGVCVRLHDKFCRVESFLEKGFNAVIEESVDETLTDVINYCVLMLFLIQETSNESK